MDILNDFTFFEDASTPVESEGIFYNLTGSEMIIEVTGDSVSTINFLGIVNSENSDSWTILSVINANDFSVIKDVVSNGIYILGIDGISKIKASITSIDSGNVSVFGKVGV